MSTQKVDLANKLMQFAELNLDQVVKGLTNAPVNQVKGALATMSGGAKGKRDAKAT